jgi:RNA polymerase sigma factor (sigma-70 family)
MTGSLPGAPELADDATFIAESLVEPDWFAVLFDRHASLIHRYAGRRAGPQAADDVVAETFLAAFRRRASYDLRYRDARPWLYGIATNLISQHRREEARQVRIRQAAVPEPDHSGHGDRVAADVTAGAMRGLLAAALAGLGTGDRDVLLLIAWEQLTYDETAHALGIPVGTVRSRLNRARGVVRAALVSAGAATTLKEILSND